MKILPADSGTVALLAAAIACLVLVSYIPAGNLPFIWLDDGQYVHGNRVVGMGVTKEGVAWAFTTFHASNWHPLTWLSHMLDVELFGMDAGWHHRVNVLLHGLNSVLLFLVLAAMTGAPLRSGFVAAVFAVHPLHVESVAWVSERKDLLCALFWILAMGAYHFYARKPGIGRYLAVACLFALALLSKPMAVTLPFVLLLVDWWPLGRWRPAGPAPGGHGWPSLLPLVREKVPLLAMSAAACAVTVLAQSGGGAVASLEATPLGVRLGNAPVAYASYLWKTAWPNPLALFYPFPTGGWPAWKSALCGFLLAGTTFAFLRQAGRRDVLPVGWLWYLGTLVPVIGLVQVGSQAMADRYTYIPMIGILLIVAWGAADLSSGWRHRRALLWVAGVASIAVLGFATRAQLSLWKDNLTLFGHAVRVTSGNWLAHNNLGLALSERGMHDEATAHFREAVRIHPGSANARNNLGMELAAQGRVAEAIAQYREAIRIRPGDERYHNNLAIALDEAGRKEEAIAQYREAIRIRPDSAEVHSNLGASLAEAGKLDEAIRHFEEALRIMPDHPRARHNLETAKRLRDERR